MKATDQQREQWKWEHKASMQSNFSPIVAVVGLGKIGLPLAVQYARHGRHVIGCDINSTVVEKINAGQSPIQEEQGIETDVAALVREGLLSASTNTTEAVKRAGVVIVIVPVVIDEQHKADFRGIDAATEAIAAGLQPGTLVVYETTLPVGTTAERFRRILEQATNLKSGQDFDLAYSPERVSSGSIFRDLHLYPKVVGGVNEQSTVAATTFYASVLDTEIIQMASSDEAEFVKLIETTYRDVNIALANEFACFADAHRLNVTAAIAAANTQPYSHIHAPGVGVGGHCIPVYPYFLLQGLERLSQEARERMLLLPRAARRINDAMAEQAVRLIEAVTGPLAQKSVLLLGVAYRGDVHETAFTSAKLLQDALQERGAIVYVDDPLFRTDELRTLGYTPLNDEHRYEVCAILLQANHTAYQAFDFSQFPHCQVVLDGRQALRRKQIEALGMQYLTLGDGKQATQDGQQPTSLAFSSGTADGGWAL